VRDVGALVRRFGGRDAERVGVVVVSIRLQICRVEAAHGSAARLGKQPPVVRVWRFQPVVLEPCAAAGAMQAGVGVVWVESGGGGRGFRRGPSNRERQPVERTARARLSREVSHELRPT